MIRDYSGLERKCPRRAKKRSREGKDKTARVQIINIYLMFKTADTANISVESLFKQLSALAL